MRSSDKFDVEPKKEVASVAVVHDGKILMMQRRDNERWTLPGGHLEEKEDPKEGAKRELKEEAGIDASNIKKLGSKEVKTFTGKKMKIHAFICEPKEKPKFTSKNDPDKEAKTYKWVSMKNFPEDIKHNLHSPRNVVLEKLGILKSLLTKSLSFDLFKSRTHKYIRKYKRGGKWVYVYKETHEGQARQIPEEAIKRLRELADLGDERAAAILSDMVEYAPEKLRLLRELHGLGDQRATKELKKMGIDPDIEELTENIRQRDFVNEDLDSEKKTKIFSALDKALGDKIFDYLNSHRNTPFGSGLVGAVGEDFNRARRTIMDAVNRKNNLEDMLQEFHRQLNVLDAAMPSPTTSSNNSVRDQGGYGNLAYNAAIKDLITKDILPEGYDQVHRRTAGSPTLKVPPVSEIRQRMERERQRREQELQQQLGELRNSMAFHMVSMLDNVSRMNSEEQIRRAREIDDSIKSVFGRSLTKEQWPYDFSASNLSVKIKGISSGSSGFSLEMQVYDSEGNEVMDGWRRNFSKENGRPHIYNAYMKVKASARGSVQIGNLINQGQRKMMKSIPGGGTIGVTANIDVGGYNWANQGFSFKRSSDLGEYRRDFKYFLERKGVHLTDQDLNAFTEPCHFSMFTNGKKYVTSTSNGVMIKLSNEQMETRSLTGVAGENPLTDSEIRSGKSDRMAISLGKMFMLGKHWSGIWDSNKDTQANKFADKYYELRDRATDVFKQEYKDLMSAIENGSRDTSTRTRPTSSTPAPTTSASSSAVIGTGRGQRAISAWTPSSGNMTMSERRVRTVAAMSQADYDHFMSNARITRTARSRIIEARRSRA
jgi:8-oxo-dGTP pyrophosphatase MutT (NUDIX family)